MPREAFIPNDVRLDEARPDDPPHRPQHGGQVHVLRQVGLFVLLAQIGAFVPAAAGA